MGVVDKKNIQTLTELIEQRAIEFPDKMAFKFIEPQTDSIQTLTYKELRDKAYAVVGELQKQITPGDRVLLVYPPGLDLIIAMFGCMSSGGICILTYPPATDKFVQKIQHIIADAKPSWALCSSDFANKFRQLKLAKSVFKIPVIKHLGKRVLKEAYKLSHWDVEHLKWIITDKLKTKNTHKPIDIRPEQIALFQYSSGSTNKPKGIALTHQNLVHNVKTLYKEMCGNHSNHVGCFWLPPYHDMGLLGGLLTPIYGAILSIKIASHTQLKPEAIDGDRPFTEFGIDSIGAVALVEELEQFLGKKLEMGLFWDYPTINLISDYFSKEPGTLIPPKISNPHHHGVADKGIFKKAGKTGVLLIHGFSGTPGEMLEFGNLLWKENITVAILQHSGHCASEKDFKFSNRHDWYLSVLNAYI